MFLYAQNPAVVASFCRECRTLRASTTTSAILRRDSCNVKSGLVLTRFERNQALTITSPIFKRPLDRVHTDSLASDALGAWSDLAALVASSRGTGNTKSPFDDLADKLGASIYCDMNGWHVYIKDIRGVGNLNLHQVLAEAIGEKQPTSGLSARQFLEELLNITPVSLGGGKTTIMLLDLVPSVCIEDASKLVDLYNLSK